MNAVAVTGIDCRFPGAQDPGAFWELLMRSGDGTGPVPPPRWDPSLTGGPTEGGFLADADAFDHEFFRIPPRDAAAMDPQQRLMLQCAWRAVEDSGVAPGRLAGSPTGVFVGVMGSEWAQLTLTDLPRITPQIGSGNGYCMIANRISYQLDLRGPCMAVDTACSSSLVAVHLAVNALLTEECDRAIAGGVNLALTPALGLFYEKAGLAAPDGRCKPFSAEADGIGRGEGVGAVVLRRLADALADGDPVYAVIRGTAVNQDGRSNGITAPSRWSQQEVMAAACRRAGADPHEVYFVEAHGTGTSLGDMIETRALGHLHAGRPSPRPLSLGSVKGNLGHTEGAAGVAGLIKTCLSLHHRTVPVSRYAARENPRLRLAEQGLRLLKAPLRLPSGEPVLAGLSSFGMGGTNAHAVLESAPLRATAGTRRATAAPDRSGVSLPKPSGSGRPELSGSRPPEPSGTPLGAEVFVLTAPTERALHRNLLAQADAIGRRRTPIGPLCRASQRVKTGHGHRSAVVAGDSAELAVRLLEAAGSLGPTGPNSSPHLAHPTISADPADPADPAVPAGPTRSTSPAGPATPTGTTVPAAEPPLTAWLFTGQGAQYPGMGARLYRESALFRRHLDGVDAALLPHTGRSIRDLLLTGDPAVHRTGWAQPALFAVGHALGATLTEVGVRPGLLLGHSVGEFAAAVHAGALSLEDAARLVAVRGALMEQLPDGGAMLAVHASADRLRDLVEREPLVGFAALNGPRSTVISGDLAALDRIAESRELDGIRLRRLEVSHAFHSPLMRPALEAFRRVAEQVGGGTPQLPFYSTLRGKRLESEQLDASYWTEHIEAPVLFADAAAQLLDERPTHLLEIGPRPVLTALARRLADRSEDRSPGPVALHPLSDSESGGRALAESVAALYRAGLDIDWTAAAHPGRDHTPARLTPYAFATHSRFWHTGGPTRTATPGAPVAEREEPQAPEANPASAEAAPSTATPPQNPGTPPQDRATPPQDPVATAVYESVAALGGYDPTALSHDSRFHDDLGLDSVALVELKERLTERLPAVGALPVQDLLPRLTSLGELIGYLRQETSA
ncbi:type I polyketide synthase [Streptomyces liliifuscus]|uniref:Acyltransferase domain-containing protein n=1 Tax=Streptomyces liliifuscus TaxID=2797636 RepID=A0A7T7L130_9ACTN|nr:type I polyketide synthase [Streptomyces liliifuscus]QQM44511.1 acyltransferase domain-containing protein [Streptomyces liliifuscus]